MVGTIVPVIKMLDTMVDTILTLQSVQRVPSVS